MGTPVERRVAVIARVAQVQVEKLESGDVADGRDGAAACREAAAAAHDSSPIAFLAAPGATMRTVNTRQRIAGVTSRESSGRAATLVVLEDVALEQVRLVIPSLHQARNHRRIPVDQAVYPLIEFTRDLAKALSVDRLEHSRLRQGVGSLVVREVDQSIELVLSERNLDVLVDRNNCLGRVVSE
jgi:hypothetical protein